MNTINRKKELVFKYLDSVFCGMRISSYESNIHGILNNQIILRVFNKTKSVYLNPDILNIESIFNLRRGESVGMIKKYLFVNEFIDSVEKYDVYYL